MGGIYAIDKLDLDYLCSFFEPRKFKIDNTKSNIIVITDKSFLVKNIEYVNKNLNKKTFFVLGTPDYLHDFNLEFIEEPTRANVLRVLSNKPNNFLEQNKKDIFKKLLKRTRESVIQQILTTLYKIQNKELRNSYKKEIFLWLKSPEADITELKNKLILLSNKKSAMLQSLLEIIDSDIFLQTHQCVHGKLDLKISKFDINYILSFKH